MKRLLRDGDGAREEEDDAGEHQRSGEPVDDVQHRAPGLGEVGQETA